MFHALSEQILLLERRVKHLDEKIAARVVRGEPCSYERAEQSALVAVLRELWAHRKIEGRPWPGKSQIARLVESL